MPPLPFLLGARPPLTALGALPTTAPPPLSAAPRVTTPPSAQQPFDDFHTQLRESLRRAPWMLVSVAFHVLLFAVLANMVWMRAPEKRELALIGEVELPADDLLHNVIEESHELLDDVEFFEEDPEVNEEVFDAEEVAEETDMDQALTLDHQGLNEIIGNAGDRALGGKFRRRGKGSGGSTGTNRAVTAGLDWLTRHQKVDGSWDSDGFHGECVGGGCVHLGNAAHDVGVTGLALLALLGSGSTFEQGEYRAHIRQALHWLESTQHSRDGCFGPQTGTHFLYGHALATLAMVEAYHLSRQPLLKAPAQRGLDFISRARNPYSAWRYTYPANGDNDVSVSGWMLFALFAGQDAGLDVDAGAIRGGMAYIDHLTDPQTHRTGYSVRGAASHGSGESMTSVALLLRSFHGETRGGSPTVRGGADLVVNAKPDWGSKDLYYWYYASYAMWQIGGTYWSRWQPAMLDTVVDHQTKGRGCDRGSWSPEGDPWGAHGGRVYSTALATLCLQVYYRYDKVKGSR